MTTVHILSRHDRVRVSEREFARMPLAERPDALPGAPYELHKVLIAGRWHACDRQYQMGRPVHFARPIVVVVPAA